MTEVQLRKILCDAMVEEYKWVPDPEKLKYDYTFTPEFEKKMNEMMIKYGLGTKQGDSFLESRPARQTYKTGYVQIGRRAFRKMTVIILVAVMMLVFAACAVYFSITWHETENVQKGTLDVTFGTEDSYNTNEKFYEKRPEIPKGFKIISESEYPAMLRIQYKNRVDETIDYVQERNLDTMDVSIDNDDESFTEIEINGYKGYAVTDGTTPYITWSDGGYLYYIAGNVSYDVLKKMAKSIK